MHLLLYKYKPYLQAVHSFAELLHVKQFVSQFEHYLYTSF